MNGCRGFMKSQFDVFDQDGVGGGVSGPRSKPAFCPNATAQASLSYPEAHILNINGPKP